MRKVAIILTALISTLASGQTHYPIKNLLGVNCHPWDLTASIGAYGTAAVTETQNKQNAITSTGFTWLRVYLDANNVKDATNSLYGFNPTINSGGGYKIDDAFAAMKAVNPNLKVNICYQNAPALIQAPYNSNGVRNTVYIPYGANRAAPESYTLLAHDMAVITARGGKNANAQSYPVFVSPYCVCLPGGWEPEQKMTKGCSLYDQVEGGNEEDNEWSNTNPLNSTKYCVQWKTTYDSVKKTDPTMSVSSTGVMTENPQILTDAINWSKANNNGVIPFDKYQFHCYPWGWSKNIASALPPEYNMYPAAKKVVAASNGVPCIVGEWGYDLHPESNLGIRPFSNYTGEQVRSFWIFRSIIGFAVAGIESSYYYRIYQDYGLLNDNNATQFETSSLFIKDDQNNITRRLSGDVFYTLSKYGNYVYDATLLENDSVRVYRFKAGSNYLYLGWTVEGVTLVTINGTNRASFTERKVNYTFPDGTTKELSSNPVMFVTSAPLAIRDNTQPLPPRPHQKFTVELYDLYSIPGRLIEKKKNIDIDEFKKGLPKGFYILKYYNEKQTITEKIQKL